jgi:hypothetical protein
VRNVRKARSELAGSRASPRLEGFRTIASIQLGSLPRRARDSRGFRDSSRASLEKRGGAERGPPTVSALSSGHVAADATFIDRPGDLGGAPRCEASAARSVRARGQRTLRADPWTLPARVSVYVTFTSRSSRRGWRTRRLVVCLSAG